MDSLVANVNEGFSMKHCVHFVPTSEHANWMVEISVFDRVMQMWKICMVVFLSLLRWKPLVKMKLWTFLLTSKCGTHFSSYLGSLMQEHLAQENLFKNKKIKRLSFHLSRCVGGILEGCGYCVGGILEGCG